MLMPCTCTCIIQYLCIISESTEFSMYTVWQENLINRMMSWKILSLREAEVLVNSNYERNMFKAKYRDPEGASDMVLFSLSQVLDM